MQDKFQFITLIFRCVVGEGFTPPAQLFCKNNWDFRRKYIVIALRRVILFSKSPGGVNPSPTNKQFDKLKFIRGLTEWKNSGIIPSSNKGWNL